MMTIEKILRETTRTFMEKGFSDASQEAEQILAVVLGKSWSELILAKKENFPVDDFERLSSYVSRRLQGEPLAYIQGTKCFYKYDFYVSPSVLIPRPETELIVEKAVDFFQKDEVQTIFDVGCGSGCIGLSLSKEFTQANLHLFDISKEAGRIALQNGKSLGVEQRVQFHLGEVTREPHQLKALRAKVDLIVANPPYIFPGDERLQLSVHEFEPSQALFAGKQGLEWIEQWMEWSCYYLSPEGIGIFEFGQGQTEEVLSFLKKFNLSCKEVVKDYSQIDRHVVFTKE